MNDEDPGINPRHDRFAPNGESKHMRRTRERIAVRRKAHTEMVNNDRSQQGKGFTQPGSQNRKK